ncbi:DUF1573 domain-containing protein [Chitinophaga sp. CF418]|nr:DUF1573 domain-containing protein [Chitinophaga sp. CF418]
MTWPKEVLKAGESGTIKGIFHAGEPGAFNREIYVHVNNEEQPTHKGTVL